MKSKHYIIDIYPTNNLSPRINIPIVIISYTIQTFYIYIIIIIIQGNRVLTKFTNDETI